MIKKRVSEMNDKRTKIPMELEPLAEEARKYKTALEFVQAIEDPRIGVDNPEWLKLKKIEAKSMVLFEEMKKRLGFVDFPVYKSDRVPIEKVYEELEKDKEYMKLKRKITKQRIVVEETDKINRQTQELLYALRREFKGTPEEWASLFYSAGLKTTEDFYSLANKGGE